MGHGELKDEVGTKMASADNIKSLLIFVLCCFAFETGKYVCLLSSSESSDKELSHTFLSSDLRKKGLRPVLQLQSHRSRLSLFFQASPKKSSFQDRNR